MPAEKMRNLSKLFLLIKEAYLVTKFPFTSKREELYCWVSHLSLLYSLGQTFFQVKLPVDDLAASLFCDFNYIYL